MGIKSFSDLIRRYAPNCYYEICLRELRGHKVAIDMNNKIFAFKSTAIKRILNSTNIAMSKPDEYEIEKLTNESLLSHLETLMSYGITPVCVFDGKSHSLKDRTKKEREIKRLKKEKRLQDAEKALYSVEYPFRNNMLKQEYAKAYAQYITVSYDHVETIKHILSSIGLPVISSENVKMISNDAEAVCATLCLPGNDYCYAGITTDSDFHVYGGNLCIMEIERKAVQENGETMFLHYAKVRSLQSILTQLKMPFEKFRDLCILLGTDFNSNIKGIGLVRGYKLMEKHGSIIGISKEKDITTLDYSNVLAMFSCSIISLPGMWVDIDFKFFRDNARSILSQYNLQGHVDNIMRWIHMFVEKEKPKEVNTINTLFKNTNQEENLESLSF